MQENRVTTKEKLTAVVRIIETRLESNEKETRDLESQMLEEIEKVDQKRKSGELEKMMYGHLPDKSIALMNQANIWLLLNKIP